MKSFLNIRSKKLSKFAIESPIAEYIKVRKVELVPSLMPDYKTGVNKNCLRSEPGLFPDLLVPLDENENIYLVSGQLKSLWLTIDLRGKPIAGTYPITVIFKDENEDVFATKSINIEVIDAELPEQELIFTQWFHCDSLSVYYGVEAFSEKHWKIIKNFMITAVKNGINLILTPIFTPPLDTQVGGERPTMQLVEVFKNNEKYSFKFDKLDRWIDTCTSVGIKYFEMAHLFTQWGAEHAPKIMATVDGEYKRIFGWETDASGDEYSTFLKYFLNELITYLKNKGVDKRCFYHISDEPSIKHIENYIKAKNIVSDILKDYKIMDALSNYDFYSSGLLSTPVPGMEHIDPFLENNVPNLWTYYCCRCAIALPSSCTRITGAQFYKFNIVGFLHWGYNFYFNQYSIKPINPYRVTDGEYFIPSGDAFTVYPAPDGTAYESIRLVAFHEGIQDMRALKLCEKLYGREYVVNLIEESINEPLTFKEFPANADYLLNLREKVNKAVKAKK